MLFQIYGDNAGWQLLGWLLVFVGLVLVNELARRTKKGGIFCLMVIPAALTIYFIAIYIGAANGAEWALNNPTYVHMNSWFHYAKLYAATAGCIGFMMIKYKWKFGKADWFKVFPFIIVAVNILIAVASDFESGIKGAMALAEYGDRWWLSSENVWLYGGWWNWVNGIAGILNILCMTGWWGIYASKDRKDMLWPDMTWCFIIAYDLWNFEYTYNNLPTHAWYCAWHSCWHLRLPMPCGTKADGSKTGRIRLHYGACSLRCSPCSRIRAALRRYRSYTRTDSWTRRRGRRLPILLCRGWWRCLPSEQM